MNNKTTKLLDIEFDINLVNISAISKATKFSYPYTHKLLKGAKNNKKAQLKVRQAIVNLYGSLIKYVPYKINKYSKV